MHNNRSRKKQNYPVGLYGQNGYYKLRRVDGSMKVLGRDKLDAFAAAHHYNSQYRGCSAI